MKVMIRNVEIGNERFVMIMDHSDKEGYKTYYGTIPYSELNADGTMKRALNGFEMCIDTTIGKAYDRRRKQCKFLQWLTNHPYATDADKVRFIIDQ